MVSIIISATLVLLIVIGIGGDAFARPCGGGGRPGHGLIQRRAICIAPMDGAEEDNASSISSS